MSEASTRQKLEELLSEARQRPSEFALFCDLDGTLAPIVERPEQVEVPSAARTALGAAQRSLGLCAVITGRPALEARRLIGSGDLTYIGNHGIERLNPGAEKVEITPLLEGQEGSAMAFGESLDRKVLKRLGIRIENKGAIIVLHWRGAEPTNELESQIEQAAGDAEAAGLKTRGGRMVLEISPDITVDKGVAVTEILEESPSIRHAIFIGDDQTDLDAFAALDVLVGSGRLTAASKIAVLSKETSDLDLATSADIRLEDPADVADLISGLTG